MSAILLVLAGFVAICALLAVAAVRQHHNALHADPGRIIYEKTVELLRERASEWSCTWRDEFGSTWQLAGTHISVSKRISLLGGMTTVTVFAGGQSLSPSSGWEIRIEDALNEVDAAHRKAAQLNAICDAIETLGENNIIPMRKRA